MDTVTSLAPAQSGSRPIYSSKRISTVPGLLWLLSSGLLVAAAESSDDLPAIADLLIGQGEVNVDVAVSAVEGELLGVRAQSNSVLN